jgi:hypothetical protein
MKRQKEPYDVGYGRPPEQFQFKKGRSGNPTGGNKRKPAPLAAELRTQLQEALNRKVQLGQGKRLVSKGAAGISELVDQFAKGDHRARRDLIILAEKLGVNLTAGQERAIGDAVVTSLKKEDDEIIADFLRRHGVEPDQEVQDEWVGDQLDCENSAVSEEDS